MIVGIGCDIVEIKRVQRHQEGLAKKLLSEREYAIYRTLGEKRQLTFLAGRFAAKEAIFKACNETLVLSSIEVLNDEQGKPICEIEKYQVHISIAHEDAYAIAYAICED